MLVKISTNQYAAKLEFSIQISSADLLYLFTGGGESSQGGGVIVKYK